MAGRHRTVVLNGAPLPNRKGLVTGPALFGNTFNVMVPLCRVRGASAKRLDGKIREHSDSGACDTALIDSDGRSRNPDQQSILLLV